MGLESNMYGEDSPVASEYGGRLNPKARRLSTKRVVAIVLLVAAFVALLLVVIMIVTGPPTNETSGLQASYNASQGVDGAIPVYLGNGCFWRGWWLAGYHFFTAFFRAGRHTPSFSRPTHVNRPDFIARNMVL